MHISTSTGKCQRMQTDGPRCANFGRHNHVRKSKFEINCHPNRRICLVFLKTLQHSRPRRTRPLWNFYEVYCSTDMVYRSTSTSITAKLPYDTIDLFTVNKLLYNSYCVVKANVMLINRFAEHLYHAPITNTHTLIRTHNNMHIHIQTPTHPRTLKKHRKLDDKIVRNICNSDLSTIAVVSKLEYV